MGDTTSPHNFTTPTPSDSSDNQCTQVNHLQRDRIARRSGNGAKSGEELPAIHANAMSLIAKNNSQEPTQHKNILDPSPSFMSEPSEEELETIGSSQLDFQKKMFYRQKRREFDAHSVGDTSLSSSNISTSPQPQRFRIQFDSSSDYFRNNIGKVRNKVKAASDRFSSSSMMQSEGKDKAIQTSSDARSAPSPPNRESCEGSNQKIGQVLSEDSQSSVESIRGIGITTEQSGGEDTSSSAFQISDTPNSPQNKYRLRENNIPNESLSNTDSKVYRRRDSREGSLEGAYRSRIFTGYSRGNPSSWSNDSSSPFVHVDTAKSHCRIATWDGSRVATIHNRTMPSSQPLIKSNTNLFLNEEHDMRPNFAPTNPWIPNHQHPDGTHFRYAPQNLYPEESYESERESAYGSSASCSSSSYTDSNERLTDNVNGIRRSPEYRKVQFLPEKEATKFDNAMRRVGSVLDKPCELQILYLFICNDSGFNGAKTFTLHCLLVFRVDNDGKEVDDSKKRPMFYCPNCKTKQRDIINFATAAGSFYSPQTYLAFYFGLYLVASLFVFGLEVRS